MENNYMYVFIHFIGMAYSEKACWFSFIIEMFNWCVKS